MCFPTPPPPLPTPVIDLFVSDASKVEVNNPVTVKWIVKDFERIEIDGRDVGSSSEGTYQIDVNNINKTNIELKAINGSEQTTKQIIISVKNENEGC